MQMIYYDGQVKLVKTKSGYSIILGNAPVTITDKNGNVKTINKGEFNLAFTLKRVSKLGKNYKSTRGFMMPRKPGEKRHHSKFVLRFWLKDRTILGEDRLRYRTNTENIIAPVYILDGLLSFSENAVVCKLDITTRQLLSFIHYDNKLLSTIKYDKMISSKFTSFVNVKFILDKAKSHRKIKLDSDVYTIPTLY